MVIKQEKWALRGKKTCHMHGGKSRGPKTRIGKEKARIIALKHGGYTKEAIAFHKESVALVRRSKDLLEHF